MLRRQLAIFGRVAAGCASLSHIEPDKRDNCPGLTAGYIVPTVNGHDCRAINTAVQHFVRVPEGAQDIDIRYFVGAEHRELELLRVRNGSVGRLRPHHPSYRQFYEQLAVFARLVVRNCWRWYLGMPMSQKAPSKGFFEYGGGSLHRQHVSRASPLPTTFPPLFYFCTRLDRCSSCIVVLMSLGTAASQCPYRKTGHRLIATSQPFTVRRPWSSVRRFNSDSDNVKRRISLDGLRQLATREVNVD